jgi:G3E family GTPase
MPTPLVVIGGYLGAGKTTLLNHLLRHANGQRIAVLVNDFGELNIDASLIEGAVGEVVALTGGCVCCSFGADLLGGLNTVLERHPAPDVVLIECSGVGLPASVARTALLAPQLRLQGIAVVLDAETVRARACDAYVGDTVVQQLQQADLFILNKLDLMQPEAQAAVGQWLAQQHGSVPVALATRGDVPPALVLNIGTLPRDLAEPGALQATLPIPLRTTTHAQERFERQLLALPPQVDVNALVASLTAPGSATLRAKGFVQGPDGQRWLLHTMGRRAEATPWPAAKPWPGEKLLVIQAKAATRPDLTNAEP